MIRRLSNARLYIDGVEGTGLCESFELPTVEVEQIEYSALGMLGTVELPMSLVRMEAKAVWLHQPPEISQLMHNPVFTSQVQLRSDQAVFGGQSSPVSGSYVALLRVRPKIMMGGTFQKGQGTKPETTFAVDFYSLTVDGSDLIEADPTSINGLKINGGNVSLGTRLNASFGGSIDLGFGSIGGSVSIGV
jgi:P2 family phage contractile tail tube protein